MLPFFGFTAYQSPRFGVLQHISLTVLGFCTILPVLLVSFFLLVPASRYTLRLLALICGNLLLVDIRTFFLGCNFVGLQSLCDSSSCEGGVILPPFFVNVFFPPWYFFEYLISPTLMLLRHSLFWQPSGACDLLSVFPRATICRGRWLPLISVVF